MLPRISPCSGSLQTAHGPMPHNSQSLGLNPQHKIRHRASAKVLDTSGRTPVCSPEAQTAAQIKICLEAECLPAGLLSQG